MMFINFRPQKSVDEIVDPFGIAYDNVDAFLLLFIEIAKVQQIAGQVDMTNRVSCFMDKKRGRRRQSQLFNSTRFFAKEWLPVTKAEVNKMLAHGNWF